FEGLVTEVLGLPLPLPLTHLMGPAEAALGARSTVGARRVRMRALSTPSRPRQLPGRMAVGLEHERGTGHGVLDEDEPRGVMGREGPESGQVRFAPGPSLAVARYRGRRLADD